MKKESKSTIEDVTLAKTEELVVEYVMTKAWKDSLNAQTRAEVDALPDSSVLQGRHAEVVAELARRFPLDSYTGEKVCEEVPSLMAELTEKEKAELEKAEAEEKLAELEKQEEADKKAEAEAKSEEAAAAKETAKEAKAEAAEHKAAHHHHK